MSNERLTIAESKRLAKLRAQLARLPKAKMSGWHRKNGAELAYLSEKELTSGSSESEAQAQYDSIRCMVAALECDYDRLEELRDDVTDGYTREQWADEWPEEAKELAELEDAAGECKSRDDADERIREDALSTEVRNDWHCPGGSGDSTPTEFRILLSTGGPACQIRGELDEHCEPVRAWLEHQDWGTPWTQLINDREGNTVNQDVLLTYARCFYFGEG